MIPQLHEGNHKKVVIAVRDPVRRDQSYLMLGRWIALMCFAVFLRVFCCGLGLERTVHFVNFRCPLYYGKLGSEDSQVLG